MKNEGDITLNDLVGSLLALKDFVPVMGQIVNLLSSLGNSDKEVDRHFTTEELSEYLPGKPAVSTLRNKFQRREIPGRKVGKRIVFLKSEIDQWLKGERPATLEEIKVQADSYLGNSRTKRHNPASHKSSGRDTVNRRRA